MRFILLLSVIFGFYGTIFAEESKVSVIKLHPLQEKFYANPELLKPEDMSEELRVEMFGKCPPDMQDGLWKKLLKHRDTLEAEWKIREEISPLMPEEHRFDMEMLGEANKYFDSFAELMISEHCRSSFFRLAIAFEKYPENLAPAEEESYWPESVQEFDEYFDFLIDSSVQIQEQFKEFLKHLKVLKEKGETFSWENCDEKWMTVGNCWVMPTMPMKLKASERQRKRIEAGESLCRNMDLYGSIKSIAFFVGSDFHEIVENLRKKELESLKIEATPELDGLELGMDDLRRWDGSLSLHPLIRSIAGRCKDIDLEKFDTTIRHRSGLNEAEEKPLLSNTHPAIMALVRGEKDIVFSARKPIKDELEAAKSEGVELVCVPFSRDALVFVQNRSNPIRNLEQKHIRDIFSGKATQWSEVGGFGGKITPLIRNANSGSQELMLELVMNETPFGENAKAHETPSMIGIFDNLQHNESAIGYSVFYYERYMVASPFTRTVAIDGIEPDRETIVAGKYPFVYDNYVIHRKNSDEKLEKILAWLLGQEGRALISSLGYVEPTKK